MCELMEYVVVAVGLFHVRCCNVVCLCIVKLFLPCFDTVGWVI